MRAIWGRAAHGAAVAAFLAAVALIIAANAPAAPRDPATAHLCDVRGCVYYPGSDARALARERDRQLSRLGAIALADQFDD